MATPELLDGYIRLEVECLDRLYLNGYIGSWLQDQGCGRKSSTFPTGNLILIVDCIPSAVSSRIVSGGRLERAFLRTMFGPKSSLLDCVDVLDAVALVLEGRTVGAREMLPTVILAGDHAACFVDTQQAHIVDRQDRVLLDNEPAVAVTAHRRAHDVGRVAQSPGVQRRAVERGDA